MEAINLSNGPKKDQTKLLKRWKILHAQNT